jgi:hypothetical protein
MAKHNSCTFGSSRINYYSSHGTVLGLEDALLAGEGMVVLLIAAFAVGRRGASLDGLPKDEVQPASAEAVLRRQAAPHAQTLWIDRLPATRAIDVGGFTRTCIEAGSIDMLGGENPTENKRSRRRNRGTDCSLTVANGLDDHEKPGRWRNRFQL